MIEAKKIFEQYFPGIKVKIVSADDPLPDIFTLASFDVIISTSVMKQGYSLYWQASQIIIHNVFNPVGAMDIIQYMARSRGVNPPVYVIPAKTHFSNSPEHMFSIPEVSYLLEEVAKNGNLTTEQYKTNSAVRLDEFLARAKTSKSGWNILGVCNFYEELIKFSELYYYLAEHMRSSIQEIIPSATVTFADILDGYKIKFSILKLDETTVKTLEASKNLTELGTNIDSIINSTTEPRIFEKMKKYNKNIDNIIEDFRYSENIKDLPKLFCFTDECKVAQALNDKVRKQCKQHIANITNKVYTYRASRDKRHIPQLGDEILVSKLGRKLSFLKNYFAHNISNLALLEKVYCFIRYNEKGEEITSRSRDKVHKVKIISMYCVEEDWYYESNAFLKGWKMNK